MHEDLFRATALSSTETFAPLGKIVNPLIGIDVKTSRHLQALRLRPGSHRAGAGATSRVAAL